jgi:hypothetical protein
MTQEQKETELKELDETISNIWKKIFSLKEATSFFEKITGKDKRIYALYMTQVYHYSYYTARNMGLAGANLFNKDVHFMQYCFEHASEETGHELMALHDLKAVGIPIEEVEKDMPPALPSNEMLIAYVKYLSESEHPFRMLGYSYWIESPYKYVLHFMETMQKSMGLESKQMTFYCQHKQIDQKHGGDVIKILMKVCNTPEQWNMVREVTENSLQMMLDLFVEIFAEYDKLVKGESKYFEILNNISR